MYLILYSRLNPCTLAFQCRMSPEGQIGIMNAPDPFILEVPPASDDLVVSQASGPGAPFSTLAFKEIAPSSGPAGRKHGGLGYRLMKLFTLDSSLALRESVYVSSTRESDAEENLPGREVLRLKKRHPTQKRQLAKPTDDFVVDDWDESVLGMGALMGQPPSLLAAASSIMPGGAMDFKPAYALTAGQVATAGDVGQAHERSFRECIEGLNGSVSSSDLSNQCAATMYDPGHL
jgi:RNA polymerase I-specific transcription initiation factor RRN6